MSPSWQSECNGLMTLSSPIQLPCPEIHVASWESKSVCWHMYESKIIYQHVYITCLCSMWAVYVVCNNWLQSRFHCLYSSVIVLLQHQEKRGDIVASLKLLIEGVKVLNAPSLPRCGLSLLQRLENNINNYLLIITHLQLSVRSSQSCKLHSICWSKEVYISNESTF